MPKSQPQKGLEYARIDQVLRQRRDQRHKDSRACYPCRQRKVKCDRNQPCQACKRHHYPEICVYDSSSAATSTTKPRELQNLTPSPTASFHDSSTGIATTTAAGASSNQPGTGPTWPSVVSTDVGIEPPPPSFSHPVPPSQVNNNITTGTSAQRIDSGATGQSTSRVYSTPGCCSPEEPWRGNYFAGENSIASMVRCETDMTDAFLAGEIEPVLGLRNTYAQYPFMEMKSSEEHWTKLRNIVPQQREITTFFHFYQTYAFPFNPILADLTRFETNLCRYLVAYTAGTFSTPNCQSEEWESKNAAAYISLVLSTLASGAQFSDLSRSDRARTSQGLARRAFEALRLANFLFRPSLDIIQSLLILGNVLQNDGQSDAAWVILGCTVRLAQSLGIHKSDRARDSYDDNSGNTLTKRKAVWSMITWQDSLLSMCHDRPPATLRHSNSQNLAQLRSNDLSFVEAMHCICRCGLKALDAAESQNDHNPFLFAVHALDEVDEICHSTQCHLKTRDACTSVQQLLESYAFQSHSAFLVSLLCRPAIRRSGLSHTQPHYKFLCTRARESLLSAVRAFVDFQAISVVPLRTWSMTHTVLSSILLLTLWKETRNDAECRDLQHKVIDVFLSAEKTPAETNCWLSPQHVRALIVLRNALQDGNSHAEDAPNPPPTSGGSPGTDTYMRSNTAPSIDPTMSQNYDPFLTQLSSSLTDNMFSDFSLDGLNASPLTFLNSILNESAMDMSQGYQTF